MRTQQKSVYRHLRYLPILIISLCLTGCSEHDEAQEPTSETVFKILAVAGVRGTLYVAAEKDGLFRFNNGSRSWEQMDAPRAYSLAVDETTLYVGSRQGVFRLERDGRSFTLLTPRTEGVNWWVTSLSVDGETIWAGLRDGTLFRSEDGGGKWDQINTSWVSKPIRTLIVNGLIIYASTLGNIPVGSVDDGVFGSVDGGNSWTDLTTGLPIPPSVHTLLLSQNTLYAGTNEGVFRLHIGTNSWILSGLHGVRVDSLVKVGMALYAGSWTEGVFRSEDGGNSWNHIGLNDIRVLTLAVFENRLYVAGDYRDGLFFSEDGGNSWHPLNKGLEEPLE